ncbi:hypothetical protein CATYP_03325 [Corynebacterium atypicum]|uniref:Uncharacterized protein n=1 Tax=Corynebacterium atypicum TaxID=191610 RepID=A0ABM5QMA1_9CORY|nr:hypothetical protein [Corynebacterium atypicum]AIG63863.1 hypothetical protein CATYP_03325 [Corynebacterium atypicum]
MARIRRAAKRPSDAVNIDRRADVPPRGGALNSDERLDTDALRSVQMDGEPDEELNRTEYFLEQRPPHYGGEG